MDEIDPGKQQAINDLKERYDMVKEDTWNMTGVAAIGREHHQQEYEQALQDTGVLGALESEAETLGVNLSDFDNEDDDEDADWADGPEMEADIDMDVEDEDEDEHAR